MKTKWFMLFNKNKSAPSESTIPTKDRVNYVMPVSLIVEPVPGRELLAHINKRLSESSDAVQTIRIDIIAPSHTYKSGKTYASNGEIAITLHGFENQPKFVFSKHEPTVKIYAQTNYTPRFNGCSTAAHYFTSIDRTSYNEVRQMLYRLEEIFNAPFDMEVWDMIEQWNSSDMNGDSCEASAG